LHIFVVVVVVFWEFEASRKKNMDAIVREKKYILKTLWRLSCENK